MTPDAYDILNAALTIWGQHAMANNDATDLRKNALGMPIHVLTNSGMCEINNVKYDPEFGIVFTIVE